MDKFFPKKMNTIPKTSSRKQIFIVLTVVLFSFIVKAQITTTVSGGTSGTTNANSFATLCGSNSNGYAAGLPRLTNATNTVTVTYSSPVTAVLIPFSDFGHSGSEQHRFDVIGQSNEVVSFGCSEISVSGNTASSPSSTTTHFGEATITSSIPFTKIVITSINGFNLHIPTSDFFNANNLIISAACPSTPVTPTLSAITLTNTCPATTADLASITASNTPANATLTWHTNTPASTATKITAIDALTAGTYYAAFYYSDADCYSDANGTGTKAVTITINTCCNAGTTAPLFK